jgi:hypothetical protein
MLFTDYLFTQRYYLKIIKGTSPCSDNCMREITFLPAAVTTDISKALRTTAGNLNVANKLINNKTGKRTWSVSRI